MKLQGYESYMDDYGHLSLKDLLDAQDFYHVHLMRYPNVVATALGRYRIRRGDSWPNEQGFGREHVVKERTLENSEVRPYSWPAILVFVTEWAPATEFCIGSRYDPDQIIPKTLYLPDGRRVPVCVIEAPREPISIPTPKISFPLNNIGGGRPIIAYVQGQEHVATIGCLVRDGHKVYALTNRHVSGAPGEILYTRRQGRTERVGVSADKQLTRIPFMDLYPGFIGKNIYVNLDIGLIDIDELDDWTAQIEGIGTIGPMMDLSARNLSLALIGCPVRGYGCSSGLMLGEIHALFYRYKSQGGFDYIADFFIGPRSLTNGKKTDGGDEQAMGLPEGSGFITQPGDSGTLFLLEPASSKKGAEGQPYLPMAIQWGSHLFHSGGPSAQPYALATCLSTVCNLLDVDLVRDWNLDQPDTWGALGHFSIASRVVGVLSVGSLKLVELMTNNNHLTAPNEDVIRKDDFKGMGEKDFVYLADVPDFYWKLGRQGHSRPFEGPSHFADMDHKNGEGIHLLELCRDPIKIAPNIWNEFYDSIRDLLTGEKIAQKHRGQLPFRVWQIFDEMVRFAANDMPKEFMCAAGVLIHYVGDACQPLHISYLYDGDPLQPITRIVHKRDGTEKEVQEPLGQGIHSRYEDDMLNDHRQAILDELATTAKVRTAELIKDGFQAAQLIVQLMGQTFEALPPEKIVQVYVDSKGNRKGRAERLWKEFGGQTMNVMKAGTHLTAVLWESAWTEGQGEDKITSTQAFSEEEAMEICSNRKFLESVTIGSIGAKLVHPST